VSNVAEASDNGGGPGSNGYAFIVFNDGAGTKVTNYGNNPRIYGGSLYNTNPT
jgi:hypothetical protein